MNRAARAIVVGLWAAGAAAQEVPATSTAAPTVITSDKVRVLGRGESVEFTGRVNLSRGGDRLTARRVVTTEKNTLAEAWEQVYLRREWPGDPARWEAWGDYGVYDTVASSGHLRATGRTPARAQRTPVVDDPAEGRFELEATDIYFRNGESTVPVKGGFAEAAGGVWLTGEEPALARRTELWSDRMDYDGAREELVFTGGFARPTDAAPPAGDRPFARQTAGAETRELRARRLAYHPGLRRLSLSGGVEAMFVFEAGAVPSRTKMNEQAEEKIRVPAR